jgi:DNA-binding IclR family transcriptional regulator
MPRPSNPTARVVSILDFLAARPDQSYGLSEVARVLGMNKATCLTVLGGLVSAGYLLQDPDSRAYTLGPSSAALGQAALVRFPAVAPAEPYMRQLSDDLGLVCTAMVRATNNLVVLSEHGTPGPLRATVSRLGLRTPFVPPLGAVFIAWATPADFARWIARAQPPMTEREKELQRRTVATIRARGFAATQHMPGDTVIEEAQRSDRADPAQTLTAAVNNLVRRTRGQDEPYVILDIEPERRYVIGIVSAPVFDVDGQPLLALVLEGFRWRVSGEELLRIGQRLVTTARELSESIGGTPPEFAPDETVPVEFRRRFG